MKMARANEARAILVVGLPPATARNVPDSPVA